MTEEECRRWLATRFDAGSVEALDRFVDLVRQESAHQNLIAPSTMATIWFRHIIDSAQLLPLANPGARSWLDIGTGAGFPGVVVAILGTHRITLVEPRARRAAFLSKVVTDLGIADRANVVQAKCEALPAAPFGIISARAVASIDALLTMTAHVRNAGTQFLLPRGRSGREEVDAVRQRWQGMFHVEQSLTDPDSMIVLANGVTR